MYVNMIVNHWLMMWELRSLTEPHLRSIAGVVLAGPPGWKFWTDAGQRRLLSAGTRRERHFNRILDEVYRTVPVPPRETSRPVPEDSPATTRWTGNTSTYRNGSGAWLGRWRLMAIDGFTLDLPATAANLAEFPADSAGGYETVYPQAGVVAISECASHAIVAADTSGCWDSEQTLAYSLYGRLTPEMLLTADRGFYSFHAWQYAASTGAQLLWRVQAGLHPH